MFADQVLDLGLGIVVERVVGGAHVGKLGIAALGIYDPRREQREFCRYRAKRTVGMPEAVAEIEEMGAVFTWQRLAVFAEIGDVIESGSKAVVLLLGDGAAAGGLTLTEVQGESQLLFVRNVLVGEQQHGVLVHAGLDVPCFFRGEGLSQVDAGNLAEKMRMKLPDRHGHGAPPDWRAVSPPSFQVKGYSQSARSQRWAAPADRGTDNRIYCATLPGGTDAERPTFAGGRGTAGPGARGGGGPCRGWPPRPKKFRSAGGAAWSGAPGWAAAGRFDFCAAVGGVVPGVPSGETEATGVSPLACSRPTSRRGQAKSSARPAGAASGSPFTKVRATSASTAAGRDPGPPSN